MDLDVISRTAALFGVLGTAVVYGTDVFCAIAIRPALALVDDGVVVAVMGRVHRYGDRRMPVPGVLGLVAAAVSTAAAVAAGRWHGAICAGVALVALGVWTVLYARISAPINRQLTLAAEEGRTLANGHALQAKWDAIIDVRAMLQGVAVAALCVPLIW